MKDFVIDNNIIDCHPIARKSRECLSSMYKLSEEDYKGKNYFPQNRRISALDMDMYSRESRLHPTPSTVDAVIGICKYDGTRKANERLLFVELKLDVTKWQQVSKSDYLAKENGTKRLLGQDYPIEGKVYFVFSKRLCPVVRRKIYSFNRETHREWEAVTVEELLNRELHDKSEVR